MTAQRPDAFRTAVALHQAGRLADAERAYRQALAEQPAHAQCRAFLGGVVLGLGRPAEAVKLCEDALRADPRLAAAWTTLGNAQRALGRPDLALEAYDGFVRALPGEPDAWSNRAVMLGDLGRHAEAVESCDRALALDPRHARALNNRGIALAALGRPDEAVRSYDLALAIAPRDIATHLNRASALLAARRLAEGLAAAESAVALDAGAAPAHYMRGTLLKELGRYEEALGAFEHAASLAPTLPYLAGALLFVKLQLCDWDGLDKLQAHIEAGIAAGRRVIHPFPLLATPASAALQRRCAEIFARDRVAPPAQPLPARRPAGGRIRLGYFSADFHDHATAYLVAELLELHDRARFEVTAFSFGPDSGGQMRQRLRAGCDHFLEVADRSDADIAALARERRIDIAIDLKGYTQQARPSIFAARAAPVQVSWLGYPGTMGAPFIDYIVADDTIIPPGHEAHYAERVVRLPGCYQANDRRRAIAPRPSRESLGLPGNGFVFCCFNNTFKISPDTFASWMRILGATPGSVLWLLEAEPSAMARLRQAAAAAGIAPGRLLFAPRLPLAEHLGRLAAADLVLDTFHCGAHTTASDALWAGVPVLTRAGETFASRVAASLVRAVGLPQLAVDTTEAYEALAIALAAGPGRLAELRAVLARREASPLFDTPAFARALETAFEAMLA